VERKKVTIQDVAQAAGVSRQTVSRAINNRDEISVETRTRIMAIVEQMGYRPSSIARGLATQHTRTLGLVIPDVANPFFSEVARGAEHAAYAEGYTVFLCNTDENPQRELAILQLLEEQRVDGVVLCSSRLDEEALRAMLTRHPTVVLVNRQLEVSEVSTVLLEDKLGAQLLTQHLIDTGHQAIGFLAGPRASMSGSKRAEGYFATLTASALTHDPGWIHSCAPTVQGGHEAAQTLLIQHPELTALFCYNDLVAIGTLKACADLGRTVPDDLAIVGFDDIPLAALVTPPLTTCRVPRYEVGAQAMRLLLDHINGCTDACTEIILSPELIVRASAP
jgi:LacI family transcriptional regulator